MRSAYAYLTTLPERVQTVLGIVAATFVAVTSLYFLGYFNIPVG